MHRGGPHRRAAGRGGLPAAGPPGRAGPGPGGQHRAPRQRGDLPGPGHRAARPARDRAAGRPGDRQRAGRLLRRRGRGHRGGRAEQPAAGGDGDRPGRPHLVRAARRPAARAARQRARGDRHERRTARRAAAARPGRRPGRRPVRLDARPGPPGDAGVPGRRARLLRRADRAAARSAGGACSRSWPPGSSRRGSRPAGARAGPGTSPGPSPGQQLEQFCRAAGPDSPGEVLLDENLLLEDPAAAGSYAELGVREVSPDGRYLAYSVDFDGDEVYQLRIRDLAAGTDLAERIERTYYGLAWAADSRALLYVVTDAAYRPHEVWRHELGTAPGPRHAGVPGGRRAVRADRPGHPQRRVAADRDGVPGHHRDPADPGRGHARRTGRCGKKKAGHGVLRGPCGRAGRGRALPGHERRGGRVPAGPGTRHGARAQPRGPRSSGRPRTPGWCAATCSGATWWWSSAAGRDPAARGGPPDGGAAADRGGRPGAGPGPGGERGVRRRPR